ncbi:hypothetical protein EV649_1787 [Kribbella sp. VKM Ac-2569]|uniref:hypothetical protein n=1 Tax=Kribbella sp. VKM Ac-2569 TaxID=2512220 RepID=UPI00102D1688|nr:hypothetical protein [Kribbella sp. VKM Ac-2569]RZT28011.1 hypothetical protein EV649_1787 [Kribbella sp. VKM Ac-2569]
MNTSSSHQITIASHFNQTSPDTSAELKGLITRSKVLERAPHLGPVAWLVSAPVTHALTATFDRDLGEPILWAWRTHRELQEAANATVAGAGSPEYVTLAKHEISSIHHPEVDVTVDQQPPVTLTFDLTLLFTLESLRLTVQGGLLVGLSPGACSAEVTLGAHGFDFKRSATYALQELVKLHTGLRLLPASAYAAQPV